MSNRFWMIVFTMLMMTSAVSADTVLLTNGDRLTGTVKSFGGDKLVLATDYAGEISLDWSVVKSFTTEEVLQLTLQSGDVVTGKISLEESGIRVASGTETLAYQRADIGGFGPIPQPEDYSVWENWHGGANLGFAISRGNTDLSSLSFAIDPSRETAKDRITTRFSALNSSKEGVTDANLWTATGRYDRFLTENFFLYGKGAWTKDEIATLDYRLTEGGGAGYRFKLAEKTDISIGGGLSALQERYMAKERQNEMTGDLGIQLTSSALDPVALTARFGYSPFLTGDSRYLTSGAVGIRVPLFGNLNFGLDFEDNYDSHPGADVKKNDLRILSTLGWTF